MILFDSGQMTCDSFKSSGLDVDELVTDVVLGDSNVLLVTDVFTGVFVVIEDEEDLRVDGFAGTRR